MTLDEIRETVEIRHQDEGARFYQRRFSTSYPDGRSW